MEVHDGMPAQRGHLSSGLPPLRPGWHCTGTPSASVADGAIVTASGSGPSSSFTHSTVTGRPRSASTVGPGTVPS